MKKINFILIAAGVILLSLTGCTKYNYKYQQSVEETYQDMKNAEFFPLTQLAQIVVERDTDNYQFVDVRNPHEFANGHLYKAISLPLKDLYGKKLTAFCDNSKTFLIYGRDASEAMQAYLYLKQLGINNIKPVGGGYDFIYDKIIRSFGIHTGTYDDEIAKYDYAEVIAQTAGVSAGTGGSSTPPPTPVVVPQKKTEGSVGGCE